MLNFSTNWPFLKIDISLFIATILILCITIFGSGYILEKKNILLKDKKQSLLELEKIYRTTVNDQALYSEYVERYKQIEQLGIINKEERLNWIETLQKQNAKLKLPMLKHVLEPQVTINIKRKISPSAKQKALTIKKTNMQIEAGLFHEVDLIDIMEGLKETNGLFNLKSCDIFKKNKRILSVRGSNFSAKCLLEWYSIEVKEGN